MRAISYSLFGYNKERQANCFDFNSYLRGMHICLRFNRILFPDWQMVVNIDGSTFDSPYRPIFEWHQAKGFIRFNIQDNDTQLCKAMLWRFKTVFDYDHPDWRYSHVICRDLDSIPTYREAQMVQEWVTEDKALHCITDSVSHTIPMMGGLVGFRPGYAKDLLGLRTNPESCFDKLIERAAINYSIKGSDQTFLNQVIYPSLADHCTEHFIKGMSHNKKEENGRHYRIDESLEIGVDPKFKETNLLAGHAGAAGFYETPTMKFLYWDDPFKEDYKELETMKGFEQIFYWQTREDLR
jgi:hypothetical protein